MVSAARTGTKRKLDYSTSGLSPPSPKQLTLAVPRSQSSKMMQQVLKMSQERQEAKIHLSTVPQ